MPLPQLVAQLADLLDAAGASDEARERSSPSSGAIERLQAANGVNSDLETALFRVDHGIRLGETLALASARARPTARRFSATTCSPGRSRATAAAARRCSWSKRSLRLGTRDASLFFHRGMIERCLGHRAEAQRWFARALETNPHFSLLWSPTARRYAA